MDKLQRIIELYAEDKLIQNSPDYSLNEFFGTIQVSLKDIESKSLKVTKNPNNKYTVYDGSKEIAYLDNAKGTVFYDEQLYGRFNSLRQARKTNPEEKKRFDSISNNPDMNYFPIEEIEFTAEEQREVFRTARGKTAALVVKYYRGIHQNNLITINYNDLSIPINFNGKDDQNDLNRILKSDFHSLYNKYGVILAELALTGQLANRDDLIDFKASLLQMVDQEDNVDETLNGLNVQQIIDKYGLSLATEEDAMINRIFSMERKPGNYKIVPVKTYEESQKYNKYFTSEFLTGDLPGAWCITYGSGHFNTYIDVKMGNGELFYFLLKEPDWNKKVRVPSNPNAFDDYATSMIAVAIKQNGMIHTATSRYNHGLGNSDHVYNEEDISKLIGMPIFEALPPLNPKGVPESGEDKSKEVLKKGTILLKASQGEGKIYQYQDSYYLFTSNSILKDRRSKKLFKFTNIKKIKNLYGELQGYLFYYNISQNEGSISNYILGLDKNLKMIIPSKESPKTRSVGALILFEKQLAKSIIEKTSFEEE